MHIILTIILIIVLISAVVALIAFFTDQLSKKETGHKSHDPYEHFIKRPLDAFLATGAMIVLSPILLIFAIIIKTTSKGTIFFLQDR